MALSKVKTTEEILIEAALSELKKKSVGEINFRNIAKKAKLSHMTAYRVIKSKEELFEKIAEKGYAILNDLIEEVIKKNPNDAKKQLLDSAFTYYDFANNNSAYIEAMFDRKENKGKFFNPHFPENSQRPFKTFLKIIHSCQQKKIIKQNLNSEQTGLLIWSALHGYILLSTKAELKLAISSLETPQKVLSDIINIQLDGLKNLK